MWCLKNDANAGAMAEHRYGAGKGTHDMVFLTMGTGLGRGHHHPGQALPRRQRDGRRNWARQADPEGAGGLSQGGFSGGLGKWGRNGSDSRERGERRAAKGAQITAAGNPGRAFDHGKGTWAWPRKEAMPWHAAS